MLPFVAAFLPSMITEVRDWCARYGLLVGGVGIVVAVIAVLMQGAAVELGLTILDNTVTLYKSDTEYYKNILRLILLTGVGLLTLWSITVILMQRWTNRQHLLHRLFALPILAILFLPVFSTTVGKVSLRNLVPVLASSHTEQLEAAIFYGDIFTVYHHAVETLPEGTTLGASKKEIITYDDHFHIDYPPIAKTTNYIIGSRCPQDYTETFSEGGIVLCAADDTTDSSK